MNYDDIIVCACVGPQGNDLHCPCRMRQKGLEPNNAWPVEKIAELHTTLSMFMEHKQTESIGHKWDKDNDRCLKCGDKQCYASAQCRADPPCMECGARTAEEGETMCRCAGDKDHCHGCELWPDQ